MSVYMVFFRETPVKDQDEVAQYRALNMKNADLFRDTYNQKKLVVYGAMEAVEGEAPDGIVILEFPTKEEAKAWYNSPEYQEALPHRLKSADFRAVIVEGC